MQYKLKRANIEPLQALSSEQWEDFCAFAEQKVDIMTMDGGPWDGAHCHCVEWLPNEIIFDIQVPEGMVLNFEQTIIEAYSDWLVR